MPSTNTYRDKRGHVRAKIVDRFAGNRYSISINRHDIVPYVLLHGNNPISILGCRNG